MKRKYKLKKEVVPIISIVFVLLVLGVSVINNKKMIPEELAYVSSEIFDNEVPVIKNEKVFVKPYNNKDVTISNYFYDYKEQKENQIDSIIYYNGSYMQNMGVNYIADKEFDVISVYDGVVLEVEDNEITGKSVKIKHSNNVISCYQGLSNVKVKENDSVKQNDIIGTSGNSKLYENLGNHLHFELYVNNIAIDPELSFGKTLNGLGE